MRINLKHFCYCFIILLLFLYPSTIHAQRTSRTINDGWKFKKGESINNLGLDLDSDDWMKVSIPHSWNSDAYVTKDYYRGSAWYKRALFVPDTEKDRQLFLRFEGVNQVASVYVNGNLVGEHRGGYTSFTFDITPYCKFDQGNIIAVKVDNKLNETVTPISGDFSVFGGIYRDVWLISTPKQHIDLSNMGSDGIFIETTDVSQNWASALIRGKVVNDASALKTIKLVHNIVSPEGNVVKTLEESISLKANEIKDFGKVIKLEKPQLWSPETPNLYRVESIVKDGKTGQILDNVTNNIGFRWYSFDAEKGFSLNGKPYKLNGVCRHQDQMPIANALSDEMHRRDMKLIKEMGANFIRISHYPQDPAILEECDKLGILAWEEIPIIDIVPEPAEFGDNCELVLREMLRQHYNHSSIIMWGYMNEILLVTQRKYKGDELKSVVDRSLQLAKRLEKVLKEEDPYRNSVMAFHGSESYNELGFGDITDIVGWNLYQGWYSDNMKQFDHFMEKQQRLYPNKPKIVSEYGAGSDKRIHGLTTKRFDFSIEYQQDYIEHYLSVIDSKPYIMGATYWNFIDFGSAQRDESMPRINNKGIVYADRTPKDVYYLFQAYYRKDIPVLRIASHDWNKRVGVGDGTNPTIQPVKIYSNMEDVELFMDGKSMGTQKCKNNIAIWDIPFTEGNHYFVAKGNFKDKSIQTGLDISFAMIPDKLSKENIKNVELAINVGSDVNYTSDESNLTWIIDREYTPGGWGYIGGQKQSTQTQINGTNDNPLFQTLRVSPEMYKFDLPNGRYEIELLFADIFYSGTTIAHALGAETESGEANNIFDIIINDETVEANINLRDIAGNFNASIKRYIIDTKGKETIEVKLKSVSGKAFVNGLKLRKL